MNTEQLIYNAILAPSGHNTQPWKFSVTNNVVRIYPDPDRTLPVVDPDNHALYISLGCALENMVIAAGQDGFKCCMDYFPEYETKECILVELRKETKLKDKELFEAIPERQSNRSMYDKRSIPSADIEQLLQANESKNIEVKAFDTNGKSVEPIIKLVKEACETQFNNRQFVKELISWIRFTKKEVRTQKDGLTAKVMGFPYIPGWLGRIILKTFIKPGSEAIKTEKQIRSSSHLFLFICEKNEPLLLIRLGYADEVPYAPRRTIDDVLIHGEEK